jgi:hypothetical protein
MCDDQALQCTRILIRLAAVAALLADFGVAAARDPTPEQRALLLGNPGSVRAKERGVRIRLEGTDHQGFYRCPYMRVRVNGHGPFTFLFDTGSSYTIFSSRVIKEAHVAMEVDRGGYHDFVRAKEIRVGDLEIRDLVAARDDDFGVDGVFGMRAFGDMSLVFELQKEQLLVSPAPIPLPGSFEVAYELDHNVPVIPVIMGTAQIPTLIDTGDDAYAWEVRTGDLHGAKLLHAPSPAAEVLNGAKSSPTFVSTMESAVRLGPLTIEHAAVAINDALPVPDFGVDFLKDFNFEFDPKRMVVAFQPLSPESGRKIRGNLSPGFTVRFDKNGIVHTVVPGSAADQRGMRPGDRILSINGRAPGTRCCPKASPSQSVGSKAHRSVRTIST